VILIGREQSKEPKTLAITGIEGNIIPD